MTYIAATQRERVTLSAALQEIISGARGRVHVDDQENIAGVDEERRYALISETPGEFSSPHGRISVMAIEDSALTGVMKYRQRMRFFVISFCIFMIVTTIFLGMMAYYYVTGVAIIHPYLIAVGVLGSLGLVATSVIDILENNKL